MTKFGRNEPCPCGSGKKFKKCCEATLIKGRFRADKGTELAAPQMATASRMAGLFKSQVTSLPFVADGLRQIRATSSPALPPAEMPEQKVSSEQDLEQKGDI